ncbi:YifB family Mg chelatase-like AAA ATPase [Peribacillus tepidiphilus]|uniref:YifB family Mg chelatase-like AAA ATPase n=1 Tax=Peribacillus tepidiphilus TaxID=2652445 RepID=UPI001290ECC2|nr:YifB family Mg chelatase-like AAA ATPase [Peribacillus tepidiphilus]
MTVKVSSIGLKGLEGYRVQVEVQVTPGTESMVIVGLPDASVKESKERVLSVVRSLECDVTNKKIVVNLSPSEQKKNGPLFDLAMTLAVLKAMGNVQEDIPTDTAFLGALSLDGSVQTVEGMLPALISAKALGFKRIYIPCDPAVPLKMIDLDCVVIQHIEDVIQHLKGQTILSFHTETEHKNNQPHVFQKDFSQIIGHEHAKRALEIAAAGEHNVLMSGPPGCGKSLLSETFVSILPPLSNQGKLEVMSLYQLGRENIPSLQFPSYRHPHHSASSVAIIGGGSHPKPGEISLAHRGVLFLDEMEEFTKKTLDMLRQPLETGMVTISRAHSTVTYPASFILIGAMNPCPCGYLGSNTHYCTCSEKQIQAYRNRVSGPVYDRMDILLSLKSVSLDQNTITQQPSSAIRKRVEQARKKQFKRYQEEICNAKVPFATLTKTSPLTDRQKNMLSQVSAKQQWSNRVQIKIVRLARTISDLKQEHVISDESIWEAMTLRRNNTHKIKTAARET